ncbi:DUF167 domain-containing protein [Jeongeupia naejangsanensis]|uniref:UPF0235 protein JMJ54_12580 n=1 Tax=Jeongeupia naejangsanensis TaxID=613195 RepID=A0ABS2BM68_9NEIS|nr:DUF167 domain-containing protein [Jeongeupia naejangsanensis]MBM3116668.1 YggU family protein [Jeongeupia naejangsanensis]
MTWYDLGAGTVQLRLHVQPGAKRTEVVGLHGDALKLRLAAPPVDGKANACLIAWLADAFAVPQRQVTIKSGLSSRRKVVVTHGCNTLPADLLNEAS